MHDDTLANDLWFHTAGVPGSHVVLRCAETGGDKASIKEAAALAVYFSKMKKGGKTAVHYCLASNVSKPRGAKPGTVNIRREKKILVKPQLLDEAE